MGDDRLVKLLRGQMRTRLRAGEDPAMVMYNVIDPAREGGASEGQIKAACDAMRDEGLLPPIDAPAGT